MAKIYVLHENAAWTAPLLNALERAALPYRDWHLAEGAVDLTETPPAGVFYSRMSASSHTRDHRFAPELTAAVLAWLESHGRRVLNGGRALQLELSKVAQYQALRRHGIRTPATIAAVGRSALLDAAARFAGRRFITKHNRAGKGLGVRLFDDPAAFARHLDSPAFEPSVDGVTLIQHYVEAPEPFITRVEFIGRKLLYAVRVDTSSGFELCPADVCEPATPGRAPRFEIIAGFDHPLLLAYRRFLDANAVDVAAFEFITDRDGTAYTYDVNTNTNYNPAAEASAGISGMAVLADLLGRELSALRLRIAAAAAAD
jgi:hypothetical protein